MRALLVSILFFPALLLAQEPTGENTIQDIQPQSMRRRAIEPVHFFLNGLPLPIISGGMGGAVEYVAIPNLAFWFGIEREENAPFMNLSLNENGVRYDNRFLGARYYYKGATKTTWFVGSGYKWGEIDTWAQRGLFTPRVNKEEKFGGVYGTAGYRFLLNNGRTWSWLLDVGLSYEPGMVKDIRYIVDEPDLFGTKRAHVETEVGYGFSPEARLGINF